MAKWKKEESRAERIHGWNANKRNWTEKWTLLDFYRDKAREMLIAEIEWQWQRHQQHRIAIQSHVRSNKSEKNAERSKTRNKCLGKRKTSINVFPHFIPFLVAANQTNAKDFIHTLTLALCRFAQFREYQTEKYNQLKQKPTFQIMYSEHSHTHSHSHQVH